MAVEDIMQIEDETNHNVSATPFLIIPSPILRLPAAYDGSVGSMVAIETDSHYHFCGLPGLNPKQIFNTDMISVT